LTVAWPGFSSGSVLVTTRDSDVATELAAHPLHLQPFGDDDGTDFLVRIVGINDQAQVTREHARTISHVFGGHPLALSQIGAFINRRKLSISEFLPLYERHSARIDSKKMAGSDYAQTLSTVWDVSFAKLTDNSIKLLNLMAFFDPDGINEKIFIEGADQKIRTSFPFLGDEME
jgi:NB-ARC domain